MEAKKVEAKRDDRPPSFKNALSALLAAQAEFPVVAKSSDNPYFKSKYAALPAVIEAIRPVLLKHGLVEYQRPAGALVREQIVVADKDGVERCSVMWRFAWICSLIHVVSGTQLDTTFEMLLSDASPQKIAAATTYCRRIALGSLTGVVTDEDDDGNEASNAQPKGKAAPPAAAKTKEINDALDGIL